MSEFPANQNSLVTENWGEVLKYFEWGKEKVQRQIKKTYSILEKIAPHLFMTPSEIVDFLENTRGRVAEIEKQAA